MSLLILTRLQPGEQSGIMPIEPFQRFPTNLFQRRTFRRVKPLKRLGKKIGSPFTWLKPGENESRFAAHHLLLAVLLLLTAFCSLLTDMTPSLTVGLLPRVLSQNQPPAAQPQPSHTFAHADTFSITNAAAEFASVGRADFVPRIAFGSSAGDRAGGSRA